MAEVLPFSQPSTITMLHSRPSSSDAFQSPTQQYPPPSRVGQAQRGMYNGQNTGYRGTAAPAQPYAFQSTPHLRQETRSISNPPSSHGPVTGIRHGHAQSASASTTSSDTSSQPSAKDDSVMGSTRSVSAINLPLQLPDISLPSFEQPSKNTPEKPRRSTHKRVGSSGSTGSGNASIGSTPKPVESADDVVSPAVSQPQVAPAHRLRTVRHLGIASANNSAALGAAVASGDVQPVSARPTPVVKDAKEADGEGLPQLAVNVPAVKSGSDVESNTNAQEVRSPANDSSVEQKTTAPPARASPQAARRTGAGPSPLSRQTPESTNVTPNTSPSKPKTYAAALQSGLGGSSPAAAHLAAVSDRDLNKGMKSRLRRAFSFGSAQELRKAAGESSSAQMARQQHQQSIDDELDAEQLEIARRQEAAGFGAGIYSGQGGFTGSTDNLSISSTASSASMMLRKMGRGAKKGARSVKGLFRPKSVIGVPAADGPLQQNNLASAVQTRSVAEVSMVTVEAERRNVNVNAHADELVGGGTGFPKLERNSIDASRVADTEPHVSLDGSDSRRSIVGSDRDRAEVLAAVKKGILKRSATGSPVAGDSPILRPSDGTAAVPQLTESPSGSLPGTPGGGAADAAAKGRSVSMTTAGDYFHQRGLTAASARSLPGTPNGNGRSISFSPRIQFHDVWSRTEYDRRGETATCNLLTPLLAQQIKEELNTFKMEMEVHELSKPHTHFF